MSETSPLPLESPRWKSLAAHFNNAGVDGRIPAVPTLLARWHHCAGTYAEEDAYGDLFESYLHQRTIQDVAYAIVPHLVSHLEKLDPDRRAEVLDDIAVVEHYRTTPREKVQAIVDDMRRTLSESLRDSFIAATLSRYPALPDDLAPAYLDAIARATLLAGSTWGQESSHAPGPHQNRRHVRFLRQSGCTRDDIVFAVTALTQDNDYHVLIYEDRPVARAALLAIDAPPGWFERTRLRESSDHAALIFSAMYRLAWGHPSSKVDVATYVRNLDDAR